MLELKKIGFEIEGEFSAKIMRLLGDVLVFKGDGSVRMCAERKRGMSEELWTKHLAVRCHPADLLTSAEGVSKPWGVSDMAEVSMIFGELQSAYERNEFHFNQSAGFHVHTSYSEYPSEIMSSRFFAYFITAMAKKFPKEYKARHKGYYCNVPQSLEARRARLMKKEFKYEKGFERVEAFMNESRYRAINMTHAMSSHGTIEFRIFPSCEPKRMLEMLQFTIKTVNQFLAKDTYSVVFEEKLKNEVKKKSSSVYGSFPIPTKRVYLFSERSTDETISLVANNKPIVQDYDSVGITVIDENAIGRTKCYFCKGYSGDCDCYKEWCICCTQGTGGLKVRIEKCQCQSCDCCENCSEHGQCGCHYCRDCENCLEHGECGCEE